MKKLTLALIFGICSMLQAQKISTINMDKCFLKYWETINAEKMLKEQVSLMEDQAVEMEKNRQTAITEFQKFQSEASSIINTPEARKEFKQKAEIRGNDIRNMENNMRNFNKDAKLRLGKQHNESRTRILEKIKKVIALVAKNKGLELILDSSGKTSNLISSVVYSSGKTDITNEVIVILNKGHEKEVEKWEKEKAAKAQTPKSKK